MISSISLKTSILLCFRNIKLYKQENFIVKWIMKKIKIDIKIKFDKLNFHVFNLFIYIKKNTVPD